jgi:DNA-binding NarL/FixJ family response regulator
MPPVRLLIVDDHSLFRESLSRHFDADRSFEVVGQYGTVADVIAGCAADAADVILLDYDLGGEQGSSLLPQLKQRLPAARVLMVTAGMPNAGVRKAMEQGASGIFLKHGSLDQLVDAIARVARGETWLDAGLAESVFGPEKAAGHTRSLTPRQSQVLRGILDGLTNKEIAWNAKVSESSVKAVIQELFQKTGVRTRSQLVRIAIERHSSDWLASGSGE